MYEETILWRSLGGILLEYLHDGPSKLPVRGVADFFFHLATGGTSFRIPLLYGRLFEVYFRISKGCPPAATVALKTAARALIRSTGSAKILLALLGSRWFQLVCFTTIPHAARKNVAQFEKPALQGFMSNKRDFLILASDLLPTLGTCLLLPVQKLRVSDVPGEVASRYDNGATYVGATATTLEGENEAGIVCRLSTNHPAVCVDTTRRVSTSQPGQNTFGSPSAFR